LHFYFSYYSGLTDLLYHLTFITQTRYTGAILNGIEYHNKTSLVSLMWMNETANQKFRCEGNTFGFGCRLRMIDLEFKLFHANCIIILFLGISMELTTCKRSLACKVMNFKSLWTNGSTLELHLYFQLLFSSLTLSFILFHCQPL